MSRAHIVSPNIRTLDVHILSPPSLILNTLASFEVHTIGDLLALDLERVATTRGVGLGKVNALRELQERAQQLLTHDDPLASWQEHYQLTSLLDELAAAGVDPDLPWSDALRRLDNRTRTLLERAEVNSLRELVLRLESGALSQLTGFGEVAAERLSEHLDQLVTRGLSGYLWGDRGRPKRLEEVVTHFFENMEEEDRALVTARHLHGKTLERAGEPLGLSRERVRQRLERVEQRALLRLEEPLEELLGELAQALSSRGGLLPEHVARALADDAPKEHITLGLSILGLYARWCPQTGYLTTLSSGQIEAIMQELRAQIESCGELIITPSTLEGWASSRGWMAPAEEIFGFLKARWSVSLRQDRALLHPWFSLQELCVNTLAQLKRAASIEEVEAQLHAEYHLLDEPPTPRQIYLSLSRDERVYYVERGMYLHRDCLPLPHDELRRICELCITRIKGLEHAISTSSLLEQLAAEPLLSIPSELSPMLLRDVMGRDPRVRLFQSTDMIAYIESFNGKRKTPLEHAETLLLESQRSMTCQELCLATPKQSRTSHDLLCDTLSASPFAVDLGDQRFIHREAIGLTERALEQVTSMAAEALLTLDAPCSAEKLLRHLSPSPAIAYLKAHPEGARLLHAMLRTLPQLAALPHLLSEPDAA